MISTPAADASAAPRFQVHAWSLAMRLLRVLLQVVLAANTLYIALIIVFFTFTGAMDPRPPSRAGWLALVSVGLVLLLRLLDWLTAATLSVEPERLVLERRGDRFEIPLASVESVRGWWWLLPGTGLSLRMQSGRGFQYGLRVADPLPVLEALGRESPRASAAARHPNTAFAHARALVRRRWYLWVLQYVLFPLLPAGAMFYTHQMVTYGGPTGQYQWYGLGPYLRTFTTYWSVSTAVFVLCAFLLRAVAELVAYVAAWLSPRRARGVRRFVEIARTVLYYLGFPALMAWQYLG
jgi:hypothetical protein